MYRQYLILTTLLFGMVLHSNPEPVRSPKIYNALISSDENLQPSHAYPLVEPVLRTTALGVAFPPLIVPQVPQILEPKQPFDYIDYKSPPAEQTVPETPASVISAQLGPDGHPKINHYGSLFPLAYEPAYVPYGNGLRLPIQQPVSYYQPYDQNAHLPPFYLNHLMQHQPQKQDEHQQQVVPQTTNIIPQQQQQPLPDIQDASQKLPSSSDIPYYPVQPPSPLSAPGLGVNFQRNPDIPDVPPPPLPISNKRKQ